MLPPLYRLAVRPHCPSGFFIWRFHGALTGLWVCEDRSYGLAIFYVYLYQLYSP